MKRTFYIIVCALCVCMGAWAQERLTAFPGAEGYGKFTTGGRGGNVYHVTRLDDCTDADLVEGTLRWALRAGDDTPRTVVFDVCGTIYLTSKLKLAHPNVTIAGQTAPGGGICIAGCNIYVCKPNVIIRYVRFRAGDMADAPYPSLQIENSQRVIVDHCSMTWSMEECLTAYDTDSTTIQWSIIGEGLYNSKHHKGARSYATQWGGEHSSMHHCLITNCVSRCPRFNGVRDDAHLNIGNHDHDAQVSSEFVNNVVYNWSKANSLYGGENDTTKNKDAEGKPVGYNHVYMVRNYFRAGPATMAANLSKRYFVQGDKVKNNGRWYLEGNQFATANKYNLTTAVWSDEVLEKINQDNYYGFVENKSERALYLTSQIANQTTFDRYVLLERYASSGLEAQTAEEAFESVIAGAGAQLPRLDEQDARMLQEAAGEVDPQYVGGTRPTYLGIIDSQDDILFARNDTFMVGTDSVMSYPYLGMLEGDTLMVDSDRDGMPDAWELAHALNPEDATDGNLCTLSTLPGYTNLEYFLNGGEGEMSQPIPAPKDVPVVETSFFLPSTQTGKTEWILHEGGIYIRQNREKYTLSGQKVQ